MSLPLRKCGLKSLVLFLYLLEQLSLPLRKCGLKWVMMLWAVLTALSLPLRKCGLKFRRDAGAYMDVVTSLAEVWIEILLYRNTVWISSRHFPCGSVD